MSVSIAEASRMKQNSNNNNNEKYVIIIIIVIITMAGKQFQFSWISMTFGSFEFKIESYAGTGEKSERKKCQRTMERWNERKKKECSIWE